MDLHNDIMNSLMGVSGNDGWKRQMNNPNSQKQHKMS